MINLVLAAQQGDKKAFEILIIKHKQSLYKIARSYFREPMDIEDVISETVYSCWRNIHTVKEPAKFNAWLTKILINNCNAHISKTRDHISLNDISESEQAREEIPSDDITDLLELLDEKYRQIFLLYYSDGFKIREISKIMNIPENTVSTRLKRGREQLAKKLEKGANNNDRF